MDAAEVQGRRGHAELRIVVLALPLRTQSAQLDHHVLHGFQGAVPEARVGRVAALPKNIDALHHNALVQADGLEAGRLADHCRTAQRLSGLGQGAGPGHRAFFIAGGENQQRLLEPLPQQGLHGFDDQGEKALHVATAQAHPTAVDFGEFERVGLPQRGVERHGVAVPGQHQAAWAGAIAGKHIEFAGGDFLHVAGETEVAKPARQQFDHCAVGLIPMRLGAAH